MIFHAEDKNNANLDRAMMGRFRPFLNDMGLNEVLLLGRKYTWSNERQAPTLVRLDRVFTTAESDHYMNSLKGNVVSTLKASGRDWRGS